MTFDETRKILTSAFLSLLAKLVPCPTFNRAMPAIIGLSLTTWGWDRRQSSDLDRPRRSNDPVAAAERKCIGGSASDFHGDCNRTASTHLSMALQWLSQFPEPSEGRSSEQGSLAFNDLFAVLFLLQSARFLESFLHCARNVPKRI
jgi:hypothetical protein